MDRTDAVYLACREITAGAVLVFDGVRILAAWFVLRALGGTA